jgi:hypothetical protein
MNPLSFRCPKTGREVATGIEIDYPALRHVQPVTVRLVCPFCATRHDWKLADGLLGEPRELQPPAITAWSPCRQF